MNKKTSSKEVVVRTGKTGSKVRNNDGKVTTPLARSKAAELGVDIAQVTGTGFNGRVLVKDVEAFTPGAKATTATKSPAKPMVSTGEDVRIKVPGIRKAIAGAMKNSWAQVAYTNLVVEVNMSSLWDFRKTITDERSIKRFGTKVTFLPFIMKATTIALKEFPMINAKYDEAANEMIQYADVNLGVAVDSPKGLMVPVVKQMQTKSIVEVNKEIQALAGLVRTGKITGKDMSGATFTVTNYGSAGALHGVPVINYPEIGILGTGAIIDRVLTDKSGGFYTGKIMHLTCAADHRWVDGADIGRFVSRVKELLENPAQLGVF
ncbi:MAG: 2-oxo acid dehydrogenase subunit E2 [Mycoplasmataceae bacterium]|nr:2-oxo acid dehydrogenase subunit E2 [Mycoplasmataceae bacterium]